jgi:hypothetical protein
MGRRFKPSEGIDRRPRNSVHHPSIGMWGVEELLRLGLEGKLGKPRPHHQPISRFPERAKKLSIVWAKEGQPLIYHLTPPKKRI